MPSSFRTCSAVPARALVFFVALSALAACKRSEENASTGAGTTTTNAATTPTKSSAGALVGTWLCDDGDETLTITATTMSRTYKKIPDAPKVATPYTVAKEGAGEVTLAPSLELPGGKKTKLGDQVFKIVDADTLSGGLATKAPKTYKRVK